MLVEKAEQCKFFVSAHQLRIHNALQTDFYCLVSLPLRVSLAVSSIRVSLAVSSIRVSLVVLSLLLLPLEHSLLPVLLPPPIS